jgi:hypothetical protein
MYKNKCLSILCDKNNHKILIIDNFNQIKLNASIELIFSLFLY